MKKTIIYGIASALILAACTPVSTGEYIPTQPGDGTMTISAKLPVPLPAGQTKVSLGETDGSVIASWQSGDELKVNGKIYAIQPDFKRNTALFKGEDQDAKKYDIFYPSTVESVSEVSAATFAAQKQDGNSSLAHIRYIACLEGVSECREVEFTAEWAAAHGGRLHTVSVLKFVATLPETVTKVSSVSLECSPEEIYTLPVENCTIGSDHSLVAYLQIPCNKSIKFEEDQKVTFKVIDQDGEEVSKTFKPGPQELYPGHINEFKVGGDWPSSLKKGKGSMEDPYLVSNVEDFQTIRTLLENDIITCFKLVADLDMSSAEPWTPINPNNAALGIYFDGDGHKISNIRLAGNVKWASIFGVLHGTVKNLTIENSVLENTYAAPCGTLCAWSGNSDGSLSGTIENVHVVNGTVTNTDKTNYFGGLIGNCNNSTVKDSSFDGTVARNAGTEGTYCNTGGFIGCTDLINVIEGCHTSGSVYTKNGRGTSGFIGYAKTRVDLKDCYSTMNVTAGNDCVGGLVGWCYGGTFIGCHAEGVITAGKQTASSAISYCGGLVGHISTDGTFADCWFKGDLNAAGNIAGGIVGQINAGTGDIRRCWFEGNIKCLTTGAGIVSRLRDKENVIISDCYSKGSITGTSYIAGICADVYKGNIIHNCYSTMSVTGTYGIGGLVARASNASGSSVLMGGQNFNITVENCIAWNSSIKTTTSGGESPATHYPAGAVVGYTAEKNTLQNNWRNPQMEFNYFPEGVSGAYTYNGYNDLYDQSNVDASHPLYRKFTDPAKDKYYFPYNGKAVPQETTVSDLAKILGWDESVWNFSGALPELK